MDSNMSTLVINFDDLRWRLLEKNIKDTLRVMRNNIYAKNGYIFKSPDLQNYYSSKVWYMKNSNFTDSLLTYTDRQNIEVIKKCENLIDNLSHKDSIYLSELYAFREELRTNGFDTTITQICDLTNDGVKDSLNTRIFFTGKYFKIQNSIVSQSVKIWTKNSSLYNFNNYFYIEKFSEVFPILSLYKYTIEENIKSVVPSLKLINGKNYFEPTDVDTLEFSSILNSCENTTEEFKKFLYHFSGYQISIPFGDGYDVKIWYPPSNSFVKLWTGP